MPRDQIAEPNEGVGDGSKIGGRVIAVALQQAPHPGLAHHVLRQIVIEWRQAMGDVTHNFHGRATGAEHQQGAERCIDRHAQNQLVRVGAPDHWLNREAGEARLRQLGGDGLQHLMGGAFGIFRRSPNRTPPTSDLCEMSSERNLDHAGVALAGQAFGKAADIGRAPPDFGRHHRYAVGGKQPFGFDFR